MTSIICLLCSCNTDDSMSNYTTKELDTVVDNNLITAIKHYNDSIYYSKNTSTRGSNTKRKKGISKGKLYAIVASDAAAGISVLGSCMDLSTKFIVASGGSGAVAAAVATVAVTTFIAGGISYGTYLGLKGCSITKAQDKFLNGSMNNPNISKSLNKILSQQKLIALDGHQIKFKNDSIYSTMGQVHNEIVTELLRPKIVTRSSGPVTGNNVGPIYIANPQKPLKNSYGITFYENSDINSLTKTAFEKDMLSFSQDQNYDKMFNSFKEKGYISEQESEILSLFFDALNDNVDVPKDLSNITDYYLTLIKTSKLLSTEEKQRLHLCIVLAENSFNLWFEKDIPA